MLGELGREPPVTARASPPQEFYTAGAALSRKVMAGSPRVGRAGLTVRDRAGRTLCRRVIVWSLLSVLGRKQPGPVGNVGTRASCLCLQDSSPLAATCPCSPP